MKSSAQQRNIQTVTVNNDTVLFKQTIPKIYYDDLEVDKVSLYDIICVYISFVIAIIIGGGGIAVWIIYFSKAFFVVLYQSISSIIKDSDEYPQNWQISEIILAAVTCIITVMVMSFSTCNKPWRYQLKDMILHPEDNIDTTLSNPSLDLVKTVYNDPIYCLDCTHSSEKYKKSKHTPNTSSRLKRAARRKIFLKKNKSILYPMKFKLIYPKIQLLILY